MSVTPIDTLNTNVTDYITACEGIKPKLEEIIRELITSLDELEEATNTKLREKQEEIVRLTAELTLKTTQHSEASTAKALVETRISELQNQFQSEKATLAQQKSSLEQQKTDLESNKAALEQQKTDLESNKAALEQQINKLNQDINTISQKITSSLTQITNTPGDIFDSIKTKIESMLNFINNTGSSSQGATQLPMEDVLGSIPYTGSIFSSTGGRRRPKRKTQKRYRGGYIYRKSSRRHSASVRKSKKRPTSK